MSAPHHFVLRCARDDQEWIVEAAQKLRRLTPEPDVLGEIAWTDGWHSRPSLRP